MAEVKETLPVTPAVVRWARERAGYSLEDAGRVFKKIAGWEAGDGAPTYPQLEQMAEKFKCPVAVFFFPAPPALPPVEESFRTLPAEDFAAIPRTVRLLLRRGQSMQVNLAELNDGKNPAPRLITRDLQFSPDSSLDTIATAVRAYLGVSLEQQASWKSVEEALDEWREVFAQVGIYAFKDAFRTNGYFGFCLYDAEFPIIYVNNSSAKSRQIFTLFHELAHLLFHTSGIDIVDDELLQHLAGAERKIEVICNGLAARILVPDTVLDGMLKGMKPNREAAAHLAAYFSVSREVIYRKFLDRGLIDAEEYTGAAKDWEAQLKPKEAGSKGNYYNSHHAYLGARYIDLAFTRYYQGRFDEDALAEYLNIKPKNLPTFEAKFGGGH
jgi:Zn-dependent peptidase ImmA (M78 family)